MKTVLMAAGAAALALGAGQALANTHHKHHADGATAAGPKQPIPYAELDAYLKASPARRAKQDWWTGESAVASSNAGSAAANTSATTKPK